MADHLKLYHNPQSRAVIAHWAVEEAGAEYDLVPVDFQAGDTRRPDFLALNPMGKVPTLLLPDGTVITETPAIVAWAADAYPEARLAPALTSPQRGPYYRWLFFGSGCFEPAMTEAMMRKDVAPLSRSTVGWGTFDDVVSTLEATLDKTPYLLGDHFTAADLYIASQLSFGLMFGAPRLKDSPVLRSYVESCVGREAYRRVNAG